MTEKLLSFSVNTFWKPLRNTKAAKPTVQLLVGRAELRGYKHECQLCGQTGLV